MSASSKKKLRKEQAAASLTEKQRKEQAEAKKLKNYSILFIAIMLVVVVTAATIMVVKGVQSTGIIEKNTIAATVDGNEINSVELSYYYTDLITSTYNSWSSQYGDSMSVFLQMMNLDLTKPLNEQYYYGDEETTWADYFLDAALERVKSDYALCKKAKAEGFKLSDEDQASLESGMANMAFYAAIYGYSDVKQYLKATYGFGANEKTYGEYSERSALAAAYYNAHNDSLTYDDAAIREYEKDVYSNYSYFDFASYYISYTKFLGEGTKGEDGTTTYTDEQHEQARADAKEAADSLLSVKNVDELDKAIGALEINKGATTPVTSTKSNDTLGSAVSETYKSWVTDNNRKENDITCIPYETTTKDADGNEKKTLNGYYVILFQGTEDNVRPLGNVRHLLVKYEGGTKDANGNTTYSDAEKAAAKEKAEGYLKTWREGAATEDSFIELVKKHSADSSASTGGLFEDITPVSNYVTSFRDWAIDTSRKTGDTGVIESEFGYHVMYYVGASELNFRDYMISNDIRTEDMNEWYAALLEPVKLTEGDTSRLALDMVLTPA